MQRVMIAELTGVRNLDEACLGELATTHRLVSVIWDSYRQKPTAFLELREPVAVIARTDEKLMAMQMEPGSIQASGDNRKHGARQGKLR